MTTPTTTHGPFSFDGIEVRGPKPHMDERRLALLDAILAGVDVGRDPGAWYDEETGVLGILCEDYDRWRASWDRA